MFLDQEIILLEKDDTTLDTRSLLGLDIAFCLCYTVKRQICVYQ